MCKVFYVPGHTAIIDYARQIGPNMWMAQHSGLMLPELRVCHPGAVLGDEEAFLLAQEAADAIRATATASLTGRTGVEMEAMTAASIALLTIYDMAKAIDKGMVISDVRLIAKSGGKSGDWNAPL